VPNRILRPGILTSERVNALKPHAELFYRRLMSVVDDFGRYSAHPQILRAHCYPLRIDEVREADISRFLTEVQDAGLIALYAVDGRNYLEMKDFRQQMRAEKSAYPSSALGVSSGGVADDKRVIADAHLVGDVVEGGDEDEKIGKQAKPARPKHSLSDDDFLASLRENPAYDHVDLKIEMAKMDVWLQTPSGKRRKGKTRAFILNWLNRIERPIKAQPRASQTPKQPPAWVDAAKEIAGLLKFGNDEGLKEKIAALPNAAWDYFDGDEKNRMNAILKS